MKTCNKCGKVKKPGDFHSRTRKGKLHVFRYCKDCHRAYMRGHYQSNRDDYLAKAKTAAANSRARALDFLEAYLCAHPCADCGEGDLVVLQFDHCRGTKFLDVTRMLKYSLKKLQEEIAKCDVVCANCHCRRTAARAGSWRLAL